MTAAHAKTPVLAWFLAALTCLLAGLATVEGRRETVALTHPAGSRSPAGRAVTGEGAIQPTATPELPPHPTGTGTLPPFFADAPVPASTGPGRLRVARLSVPPGAALPPEVAAGPTVLLVESGTLSVLVDGEVGLERGLEGAGAHTVLNAGEHLVIGPGKRHSVRNDGPTPVEALVVAIVPVATATPMLGPGEPPPPTACPGRACNGR